MVNSDAKRGPNGIWNEDQVPVASWESPAYRIVLPLDLQQALGFEAPILRWDETKRIDAFTKHPELVGLDLSDGVFWRNWDRAGREPTRRTAHNVIFTDGERTYIAAMSRHHGEITMTTMFSPRADWLAKRQRAGDTKGAWNFRDREQRKEER